MEGGLADISAAEGTTLSALFDEDADLSQLVTLLRAESATQKGKTSDEEIEVLLREHWGMNHIDIEREASAFAKNPGRVTDVPDVEDDFTDEEWMIVRGLRDHCRKIIRTTMGETQRKKEITWAFVNGTEDNAGLSFHLACEALQTRPMIVQALIQHYWGLRDIIIPPLPFLADPLPDPLFTEALYHGGELGGEIARAAWAKPSASIIDIERDVKGRVGGKLKAGQFDQVLAELCEPGLIQVSLGRVHFISRPAALRKWRRTSWARTFIFEG